MVISAPHIIARLLLPDRLLLCDFFI